MHRSLLRAAAAAVALAITTTNLYAQDKPAAPSFEPNGTVHVPRRPVVA